MKYNHMESGKAVNIQVVEFGGMTLTSIKNAVKVSGWSRAYVNKLLNSGDVAGMRMDGSGWLVDLNALAEYKRTSGRAPGIQSMLNDALDTFLAEHGLADDWSTIRDSVVAAYEARKEQESA